MTDLTGKLFDRWHVDSFAYKNKYRQDFWNCTCECGTHKIVMGQNLRQHKSKSCGCLAKELASERNFDDLTGQVFGELTVLEQSGKDKNGAILWKCKCSCGKEIVVLAGSLRSKNTTSCGHKVSETAHKIHTKNIAGQTFGKLYVLEDYRDTSKPKGKQHYCKCLCLGCNSVVDLPRASLVSDNTKSCGCWHSEYHRIHGMSNTKFYNVYASMLARCNRPTHHAYKYYGGRGIKVCDRWEGKDGFIHFKEDMYESYLKHIEKYGNDTSIDRIDVNGNYEPLNCRWATQEEQGNNRRNTRYVIDENTNEEIPVSLYCKKYNYNNYDVILSHKVFYK